METNENVLVILEPDEEPTRETNFVKYKFSDELFNWFYDRLKYYSEDNSKWFSCCDLDREQTYNDNKQDGCRIYFYDDIRKKSSSYFKFYDTYLMISLTPKEYALLHENMPFSPLKLSEIVNFYYEHLK